MEEIGNESPEEDRKQNILESVLLMLKTEKYTFEETD